jgi:hypothetical protein
MAMALAALVGAAALAVDVAIFYFNWHHLQKAADAAATAGASYLPYDTVSATNAAVKFAESNGIQSGEITSTQIAGDRLSMSVKLTRTVAFNFARVLGLQSAPISAVATAGVLPNPNGGTGLMPLGLPCSPGNCTYVKNQLYNLKQGLVSPGNYGALALGGTGSSGYVQNIQQGYYGPISIGDLVTTEPGNVTGPTDQGFGQRITEGLTMDPTGSYLTAPAYDPRMVIMAMIDFTNTNGRSQAPVVGFGLMWVDSVVAGVVNAYYLGPATYDPSQRTVNNFGLLTPTLLQ